MITKKYRLFSIIILMIFIGMYTSRITSPNIGADNSSIVSTASIDSIQDKEALPSQLPLIVLPDRYFEYYRKTLPPFYPTPAWEPEPHPFDGMLVINVYYADINYDGVYEAYATGTMGSGIVHSYLLGYDPVTKTNYQLSKRMEMDYSFCSLSGELYVVAWSGWHNEPRRYYRPQLNQEMQTFDLEPVDKVMAAVIARIIKE